MKVISFTILLSGLLLPLIAWSQDQNKENSFSMSAQIRPRAEYRNGVMSPRNEGAKPATFINNRARLSMEYKRSDLTLKMSAQHVGVWGQDPQIDKNGRFILNEAWARLNFGKGFFTQIGRQTLSYDDERILGGLDWNVAGRYHDALKLGYENQKHHLHLILAFNQNDEKVIGGTYYQKGAQPYKNMQTIWYNYTAPKNFTGSLLFMNLGLETGDAAIQKSNTRYLQTMGTYLTYKIGSWDLNGAFYYQCGKNQLASDVSASMWSIRGNWNISSKWGLILGSDHLSGDRQDSKKYEAFDPLYGTHHKFYGAMDYFYATLFTNGLNPGVWDNQVGIAFKPGKTTLLTLNYHYFAATTDVDWNGKNYDRGLGSEFDLQIDWTLAKDVKLSAGYSFMAGTETMDIVKGGNHDSWQDWGWLSLNINPKIFSTLW